MFKNKSFQICIVLYMCLMIIEVSVSAQTWKPANGPLFTKWAKEVSMIYG